MNAFDNAFERKWTLIFLFEFFFIMMPFPWFYDLEYTPWLFGVPRCMKRPEYQEYED